MAQDTSTGARMCGTGAAEVHLQSKPLGEVIGSRSDER